jgi:hypothetical protein
VERGFGGAIVVVAVVFVIWSRLAVDPECTEGPCSQDGPLLLGGAVIALIVLAWIITAIAMSGDSPDNKR